MTRRDGDPPKEADLEETLTAFSMFTVTMLDVLLEPFETWLASRSLQLIPLPGGGFTTTPTDEALRNLQERG
jgi:hypothetical protein